MVLCTMAKHLYFGLVCPQERSLLQFCMLNLYVELMMFRIGSFLLMSWKLEQLQMNSKLYPGVAHYTCMMNLLHNELELTLFHTWSWNT